MAIYDVTPTLNLKKTRRGEREWSENERENWDKLDQFAQIVLSNPPPAGTPAPVFNTTYNNVTQVGVLDPSYMDFTYDADGEIIEAVEHYNNANTPPRRTIFTYDSMTRLMTSSVSFFNGVKYTTNMAYDVNSNLISMLTLEEVIE